MATSPAPNSRASLLAGLRTGGVRSVSGPAPHTASPAGTFNVPRYAPSTMNDAFYTQEEEDELADMVSQNLFIKNNVHRMQQPMTAAVDGGVNRFALQQAAMGMNGGVPMNPYASAAAAQTQMQAMQMQMMQLEIARLQVCSHSLIDQQWLTLMLLLFRLSNIRLNCLRKLRCSALPLSLNAGPPCPSCRRPQLARPTAHSICALLRWEPRLAGKIRLISYGRCSALATVSRSP